VEFAGSGFDSTKISISVDSINCRLLSVTPTQVIFRAPAINKNQALNIVLSQNGVSVTCSGCLNYQASNTPAIASI
jgi:hypothetical protein